MDRLPISDSPCVKWRGGLALSLIAKVGFHPGETLMARNKMSSAQECGQLGTYSSTVIQGQNIIYMETGGTFLLFRVMCPQMTSELTSEIQTLFQCQYSSYKILHFKCWLQTRLHTSQVLTGTEAGIFTPTVSAHAYSFTVCQSFSLIYETFKFCIFSFSARLPCWLLLSLSHTLSLSSSCKLLLLRCI